MKKTSTVQSFRSEIFKDQKLTIGLDPGDLLVILLHVMDEAGQVIFANENCRLHRKR